MWRFVAPCCAELRAESAPGQMAVPPPPASGSSRSDQIDYRIVGEDMQFVEIELDPGESAVAEAGTLMYKDSAVRMETVFGDGSAASGAGYRPRVLCREGEARMDQRLAPLMA